MRGKKKKERKKIAEIHFESGLTYPSPHESQTWWRLKNKGTRINSTSKYKRAYPAELIHYASSVGVSKKARCSFHTAIFTG